ncbi:substrate-binding domain-containing protein [Paenibacillus sp. YIM B09110]|uniref:substrate-binding domain-containing protein n=1 Tax=Paenibacillus sp. YIM B09110 TaxID=3126102 RepID=UPI00301B9FF7
MRLQRFTVGMGLLVLVTALFTFFYFQLYKGGTASEPRIAVMLKSTNVRSDFWQTVREGAVAGVKGSGARLEVMGSLQDTDAAAQVRLLEDVLMRKPEALVVAPIEDAGVRSVLARIREAGIKLVVMDMPMGSDFDGVTLSSNYAEAGRQAGEVAAAETAGAPRVAVLSDYESSSVSAERVKGIRETIDANENSFVGTFYSDNNEDRAYVLTSNLLSSEPDMNAIIALSEPAALGAAKAVEVAGKQNTVKLIAFDSSLYEIKLLEEGSLSAMIVQRPFNMGYLGVRTALKLIDRKTVPRMTYIDSIVVTRDNMYSPENQKLLFPFR